MRFTDYHFGQAESDFWTLLKEFLLRFDSNSIYDFWILFIYFQLGIIRKDRFIIYQVQYILKEKIDFEEINEVNFNTIIPIEKINLSSLKDCIWISYWICQYNYQNDENLILIYSEKIFNNLTNIFEPDIVIDIPIVQQSNKICKMCGLESKSNGQNIPFFKINDNKYLCPNCYYLLKLNE